MVTVSQIHDNQSHGISHKCCNHGRSILESRDHFVIDEKRTRIGKGAHRVFACANTDVA